MRRRGTNQSAIGNRQSGIASGFTLVELLVVIGIIVLLIGILLPVVRGVKVAAYAADSQQQISRLTAAIEAYYGDHKAYPGPLSNDVIITGKPAGGEALPKKLDKDRVTMAENLVLGLIGGLKLPATTTPGTPVEYDSGRIINRMGAMTLNSLSPKAGHTYIEVPAVELSMNPLDPDKHFNEDPQRSVGGPPADDSIVPEFVDKFPDPLPVIYLRARKGVTGVISDSNKPSPMQYDLQQYSGYTKPTRGTPSNGIGGAGPHGLNENKTAKLIKDVPPPEAPWGQNNRGSPPYPAIPYFANPALNTATIQNATGTPRQKDGYILISPGKDRVYGTRDDITNFGSVN